MGLNRRESILVEDPLNDDDMVEFANRLSDLIGEMETLENDKKEYTTRINAKIKDIDAEASDVAKVVRTGYVVRMVDCEKRYDFKRKVVEFYRIDNGELASFRPMLPNEMQPELFENGASRWETVYPWDSWIPVRQNFPMDIEAAQELWDVEYLPDWFDKEIDCSEIWFGEHNRVADGCMPTGTEGVQ